jgi:hypothetical protein
MNDTDEKDENRPFDDKSIPTTSFGPGMMGIGERIGRQKLTIEERLMLFVKGCEYLDKDSLAVLNAVLANAIGYLVILLFVPIQHRMAN